MLKKNALREGFDFPKYLTYLRSKWKIVAISVIGMIAVAVVINKFVPYTYQIGASILLQSNDSKRSVPSNDLIQGFQLFSNAQNIQDEILILQSLPLLKNVAEQLDLRVQYYQKQGPFLNDIYKSAPFDVKFDITTNQIIESFYKLEFLNDNQIKLSLNAKDYVVYNYVNDTRIGEFPELVINQTYPINSTIKHPHFNFSIHLKDGIDVNTIKGITYSFQFNTPYKIAAEFKRNIEIKPVGYEVSVVSITLNEGNQTKGIDVIDNLIERYMKDKLEKKNLIAVSTLDYIDNQLAEISDSLSFVEQNLQQFRLSNQVMDISSKSTRSYNLYGELKNQKAALEANQKYYKYMENYINENQDVSNLVAPSSMGIQDQVLTNLTQELITASNEKNSLIRNNQGKSPYLKSLNIRIENLNKTIAENIRTLLVNSEIAINEVDNRITGIEREIRSLPMAERKMVGIERKYNINDAIYTFLLEKRAEAHIAKASNLPETEIIEPTRRIGIAFPKTKFNYALAIILGIFLPASILLIKFSLNDTINSHSDLEQMVDIPILGKVHHADPEKDISLFDSTINQRAAESFRGLRTNLNFFQSDKPNKIILISSAQVGEGKSFVAKNLAQALAYNNQRTLLLDFDMRKKTDYFNVGEISKTGISNYLIGENTLEEIIEHTKIDNLQLINSGSIPPNPVELISNGKLSHLIEILSANYDRIIIDTPPIGLLSDGYLLTNYAHLNLIVIREKVTKTPLFIEMMKEIESKNLNNIALISNDVTEDKGKNYYNYKKQT